MVIEPLSLDDINRKAPYKVWKSATDGSFRFMSDSEIIFVVDFMEDDLIISSNTFQLIIGNVENKKSPRDVKVRITILAIVEEFFIKNRAALLYICETGDGRQMARGRLFAYWFESSSQRRLYTTMTSTLVDEEGIENTATLIIRNDNPDMNKLITEFTQTVTYLSQKPSNGHVDSGV